MPSDIMAADAVMPAAMNLTMPIDTLAAIAAITETFDEPFCIFWYRQ